MKRSSHKTNQLIPGKVSLVTPEEYHIQSSVTPLNIEYGFSDTPFGICLLALCEKGICFLGFTDEDEISLRKELEQEWPLSFLSENKERIQPVVETLFSGSAPFYFDLYLKGTPFRHKVWLGLLEETSRGELISYGELAARIGVERAVRAVATAIGHNPVSLLVPCHRIIRKEGVLGQYRWGADRKALLIRSEQS